MVAITVQARGKAKGFPLSLDFPKKTAEQVKVDEVKSAIFVKAPTYYADRQRLTIDKKPLDAGKTLADYGIRDGDTIQFKDLGPQIAWQTVFLVEYGGPLIIHPIFFFLQKLIYGKEFERSQAQYLAFGMVMLHYIKRELETLYVHRFSHGTMPVRNIFKNSAHYWIFGGAVMAWHVYGPWNDAKSVVATTPSTLVYRLVAIWAWAELSNLRAHVTLRQLRPKGSRVRAIPMGYGFNWVTSPNYFFESVGWACFAMLTRSWAGESTFQLCS